MINKARRIMIADPDHFQRLRLERNFNLQGYYAIAPVSNLKDVVTLLRYGDRGFDLVLINGILVGSVSFDLQNFYLDHPLVAQVYIYDLPPARLVNLPGNESSQLSMKSE